ncbi:MAG: putative nucleotidyltransferase with HDIG domain [Candidatus Paceibacteria bacterium]|jgi:putative nucleotidyltransferase with HDIG domain
MKNLITWIRQSVQSVLGKKKASRRAPSKPILRSQTSEDKTPDGSPKRPPMPNLDGERVLATPINHGEKDLVERIASRIEAGNFELPQLPATTLALVNLAGKPGVDVSRVVQLISSDPSLAGELLRVANSVLYATHVPAATLNEAVMRIGLRGLRTLIFSVSVKGTIMRLGSLERFSEEVWRQAFSVASIARKIAPIVGIERERAFLIGLLHDIGKIALLALLSKEMERGKPVSPALVGRVFYVHHERAGQRLAEKWRLDEELTCIAGNHHKVGSQEEYSKSAALASLAHKLDLHLSFDDPVGYRELLKAEEFDELKLSTNRREAVLEQARRIWNDGQEEREDESREAA